MKFAISTAALLLLLGSAASGYGPQEHQQEGHSQESKPAQQQHSQESKPAQQHSQAAQHDQQGKPANQQHASSENHAQQQHASSNESHSQQSHSEAQNRGGNNGNHGGGNNGNHNGGGNHGRISDDHYSHSFGREHSFHVNRGDYDRRRFDYGGYSWGFSQPWPVGWGYDDDVYVMYTDGGYYMYNRIHPGLRLSINIF